MALRLDNILIASEIPNYINIVPNITNNIVISGTYATGTTTNFSSTLSVSSNNTRADLYAYNASNGKKQLISSSNYLSNDISTGGGVYQHKSTEYIQLSTAYSTGSITVTISVNNYSGGTITLITQTIAITAVQYQIPF
jgi:hypothetical protein